MDKQGTLTMLAMGATLFAAGLLGGNRKPGTGRVSLVPWGAFAFLGLVMLILAGVHLPSVWHG